MAKQQGIVPIKGTIGNLNFFRSQDGYMVREKTSLSADRIANDPNFQRTRENGSEFGRAAVYGKLLRSAFQALLINAADGRVVSRLTGAMRAVIKADTVNERGKRNIIDGEAELLQGFDFNVDGKLDMCLKAQYTASINRTTGVLEINIPSIIPRDQLSAPEGATHYKINSAGAAIDFENNVFETQAGNSGSLPLDSAPSAILTLTHQLPLNSAFPLFLVVGIEYFQSVNGRMYPLKSGNFNALKLVKVVGY